MRRHRRRRSPVARSEWSLSARGLGVHCAPNQRERTGRMASELCRWGILGTADIARKNWQAIALAGNATVTAVASRSLERSREFVARCQAARPLPAAPAALGSYDELLARPDVDAVYIPLPT